MKLTDCTYACNSLTDFESEVHAMTGNGNQVNLLKLREMTSSDLIIGGFSNLELLCDVLPPLHTFSLLFHKVLVLSPD